MTVGSDSFTNIWMTVVDELNDDTRVNPPLTRQQKAWLSLVQPLTLAEGFALLSVPNRVVQEHIERDLRDVICTALSRELGETVDLGVRIQPIQVAAEPHESIGAEEESDEPPQTDDWKSRRRHFGGRDGDHPPNWSDSFGPGSESTAPRRAACTPGTPSTRL